MKYCPNCGQMLVDDAEFCTGCGTSCQSQNNTNQTTNINATNPTFNNVNNNQGNCVGTTSGITTATKVFMIISIVWHSINLFLNLFNSTDPVMSMVFTLFGIVALCLSVWFFKKHNDSIKNGTRLSTGFKVCNLLFNDLISGILLLCDKTR